MAAKQDPASVSTVAAPGEPLDLATSAAGEEDPGAAVDIANASGRSDQPAGQAPGQPSAPQGHMRPGDEAPAGTTGTGETVCPRCGGSGKLGASACPDCEGTGKVTVGIGGA
jgi:hypothetical protein